MIGGCAIGAYSRLRGEELFSAHLDIYATWDTLNAILAWAPEAGARSSNGRSREDFYYRVSVFPLRVPPLRERGEDVLLLARHFLRKFAAQASALSLSASAEAKLRIYEWPGNVRELENAMQLAVVLCRGRILSEGDIALGPRQSPYEGSLAEVKDQAIRRVERQYLEVFLALHKGNVGEVARKAGASRQTIWRLIRKYEFALESYRLKPR